MKLVKSNTAPLLNSQQDPRLTPEELVAHWKNKITVGTLANWRVIGKGPKFMKIGTSVLYLMSEIEAYERSQTASSTSHFSR